MSTPTFIALLLFAPASSPLMLAPLLLAAPVLMPKRAFRSSLNAPAVAVLATVSDASLEAPTCWFATVTVGAGVVLPTAAL